MNSNTVFLLYCIRGAEYYLIELISLRVISFRSLTLILISPFYSLGKMGAEWNKFPKNTQNAIQDQLAACFREMTPQGNVILHSNYINLHRSNT